MTYLQKQLGGGLYTQYVDNAFFFYIYLWNIRRIYR